MLPCVNLITIEFGLIFYVRKKAVSITKITERKINKSAWTLEREKGVDDTERGEISKQWPKRL